MEAGDIDRARPLIDGLASELYAEPRAHAKVLEGVIALSNGDAPEAMSALREANDLFDTWIGFFALGRASLAAGAFPRADSAFDVCLNTRRGKALALFVDEEPTYVYLPLAYYYRGGARETIGTAGYATPTASISISAASLPKIRSCQKCANGSRASWGMECRDTMTRHG